MTISDEELDELARRLIPLSMAAMGSWGKEMTEAEFHAKDSPPGEPD